MAEGLESLDFSGRQRLLRLLVERSVVEDDGLRVKVVVPPDVLQGRQEAAAAGVSLRPFHRSNVALHSLAAFFGRACAS